MPNMRKPLLLAALAAAVAGTAGCVSTVALDRAVLAYDMTSTESVAKQLLLNIARARHNEPMHFTAISSIAATYRFAFSAGVGGALTGDRGNLLVPLVSSSAEENPTISISPMQGEEFTQRLLTPFQEQKLTLLLRQRYDVDALLRLMAAELQLQDPGTDTLTSHFNRPADKAGYPVFRRAMAHLSSVQDRYALRVEPLHFQYTWTVAADALTPETYSTIYKDFASTYDPARRSYQVSKRVNGRVIITNYDPAVLSNEERSRLHAEAEEVPANDILLDIRAGHPGGELPMRGRLRLRSFHEILSFVGRGMAEEPEYDVPPDPRTPTIGENPVSALQIVETAGLPAGPGLSVTWRGNAYAVQEQSGYQWNKKAFSLLYQLFQMSVATARDAGPAITISK